MSWDHSSDISTVLYEEDENTYDDHLIHSMIDNILADDNIEDEVFEDVNDETHLFNYDEKIFNKSNSPLNFHLHSEFVQPGRVYRLESKLPVPLDLHLRENQIEIGKVCHIKRLNRHSKPSTGTGDVKRKLKVKNKRPVLDWFVKWITVARKKPPDKKTEENLSSENKGEKRESRGAASS